MCGVPFRWSKKCYGTRIYQARGEQEAYSIRKSWEAWRLLRHKAQVLFVFSSFLSFLRLFWKPKAIETSELVFYLHRSKSDWWPTGLRHHPNHPRNSHHTCSPPPGAPKEQKSWVFTDFAHSIYTSHGPTLPHHLANVHHAAHKVCKEHLRKAAFVLRRLGFAQIWGPFLGTFGNPLNIPPNPSTMSVTEVAVNWTLTMRIQWYIMS